MGRPQSKTLPNWGEFLIGVGSYEGKKLPSCWSRYR